MKNLQTLLIILTAVLFFTACQKEESPELLNVYGEVLVQDALTPTITSPLEGINVYLLNSSFTIDTIAYWFTKTDVLDSTKTDIDGSYKFSNLQDGDYFVLPVDTILGYQFDWSNSPDPNTVSAVSSQTVYTINFTAPEVVAENSSKEFTFKFNNSGVYKDSLNYYYGISIERKIRIRYAIIWGSWSFYPNESAVVTEKDDISSITIQNTNSFFKEYKDEFKLHFYVFPKNSNDINDFTEVYTQEVNNPNTSNSYDVDWDLKSAIVTSTD